MRTTKKTPHRKKRGGSEACYHVDELARLLGVSRQAVYNGLRLGLIPCIRLGKRYVLPKAAISEWLRRGRVLDAAS